MSILGDQYILLKNPEKWLSKFNLDDKIPMEDHIKSFMKAIRLRNVIHEDVILHTVPLNIQWKGFYLLFHLRI